MIDSTETVVAWFLAPKSAVSGHSGSNLWFRSHWFWVSSAESRVAVEVLDKRFLVSVSASVVSTSDVSGSGISG